jgi:hypothetical protein
MKLLKTARKHGIGLYTYEQEKYTTPFQYFAQIVVGTVVASLGIALGYSQYHSATRSTGGLITSGVLIVIGIFLYARGRNLLAQAIKETVRLLPFGSVPTLGRTLL